MNWLEHPIIERKVMLQQVADSIHLPDYAIEKDWWVTMVLIHGHSLSFDDLLKRMEVLQQRLQKTG